MGADGDHWRDKGISLCCMGGVLLALCDCGEERNNRHTYFERYGYEHNKIGRVKHTHGAAVVRTRKYTAMTYDKENPQNTPG